MSRTVQWIVGIIIVAAIAVGIGVAMNKNNDNNQTTTTTPPPATSQNNNSTSNNPGQSESKKSNDVTIENMAFTPSSLTVKKGLTITWTNKDSLAHTVTSDSGSELASGTIAPGSTYSHNFSTVGTYKYHCSIHPNMTGTITVTE